MRNPWQNGSEAFTIKHNFSFIILSRKRALKVARFARTAWLVKSYLYWLDETAIITATCNLQPFAIRPIIVDKVLIDIELRLGTSNYGNCFYVGASWIQVIYKVSIISMVVFLNENFLYAAFFCPLHTLVSYDYCKCTLVYFSMLFFIYKHYQSCFLSQIANPY